ncbi:MAG: polyprenyl synthetase family protein [Nanoarchaeota archaeon]|nr:polyprenyl synthetase family protein [Nanoarchaeota archaeon]
MHNIIDITTLIQEEKEHVLATVEELPFLSSSTIFSQQPYDTFLPHFYYAAQALEQIKNFYEYHVKSAFEGMGYNPEQLGIDMNYFFKGKYLRSLLGILIYGICTDFSCQLNYQKIHPDTFERNTLKDEQTTFIPYGLATSLAVVELTHMASLILDDAIDKSPRRRQAKTLWSYIGDEQTSLTSHKFLTRASNIAGKLSDPYLRNRVASYTESLMNGESIELALQKYLKELGKKPQKNPTFSENEITYLYDQQQSALLYKTAPLLKLPVWIGALYAGLPVIDDHDDNRDSRLVEPFISFAESLGILYQYIDDRLDVMGEEKQTGKRVGHDLEQRIFSSVSFALHLAPETTPAAKSLIYKALTRTDDNDFGLVQEANAALRTFGVPHLDQMINTERIDLLEIIPKLTNNQLYQQLLQLVVTMIIGRNK